jgi:hypothetical protein
LIELGMRRHRLGTLTPPAAYKKWEGPASGAFR